MRVDPGKTNIWAVQDENEEPIPMQGKAATIASFVLLFGFFIKILFL